MLKTWIAADGIIMAKIGKVGTVGSHSALDTPPLVFQHYITGRLQIDW